MVYESLGGLPEVLATYQYKLPHATIPLLIVDHDIEWEVLRKLHKWHKETGCIILTYDDIERGNDVFALKFLHMQTQSTLVHGNDVFKDLVFDAAHVRLQIELLLRTMLIDLREMMLVGRQLHDITEQTLLAVDRLVIGVEFMKSVPKEIQDILTSRETKLQKDLTLISLKSFYRDIVVLLTHIDRF